MRLRESEEFVSKVNHTSSGSHICQVNETMPGGIMMSSHTAAGSFAPILQSSELSHLLANFVFGLDDECIVWLHSF